MNAADTYERLVRPILVFSRSRDGASSGGRLPSRRFTAALRAPRSPFLSAAARPKTLFGINFPNPVGLAAGFDKNGVALPALAALGFGFIEIGTVTAKAQPGNPKPRIFRYPEQGALINRLGFNNDGADVVAARLRRLRGSGRWPGIPVGINLGKSKITPIEEAADDYLYSFRLLREFADYVVLNVSSPNTPGLRTLQEHDALQQLLRVIRKENQIARKAHSVENRSRSFRSPISSKIIATCEENDIAGIIATNTTLDHAAIPPALDQAGGLSGLPLREKSTEFVRAITARSRLPVIASGGISDAAERARKTRSRRAASPGLHRLRLPRPRIASRDRGEFRRPSLTRCPQYFRRRCF